MNGLRVIILVVSLVFLLEPIQASFAGVPLSGLNRPAPSQVSSPSTLQKSCGVAWTGWLVNQDADVNPCPQGCVRGEKQMVNPYTSGNSTQYQVRYQCYQATTASTRPNRLATDLSLGALKPSAAPVGVVTPDRGPWHSFVHITGDQMGNAISVQTMWYPNDDDSQPPLGSLSTTLRGANPQTGAEIEIPDGAGGSAGGVVRIMIFLPGQKEPLFAGRFTVDNGAAGEDRQNQPGSSIATTPATPPQNPSNQPALDASQLPTGGVGGLTTAGTTPVAPSPSIASLGGKAAGGGDIAPSVSNLQAPGPAISEVAGQGPTAVKITWTKVAGAKSYVAYAVARGENQPVVGPELADSAAGNSLSYTLDGLLPGFDYTVWVAARYPDGRTGTSEQKSITMPSPENPKSFAATVTGPDTVRLSWESLPGAAYYWVEGFNLPRTRTSATTVTVSNLPAGSHEWTVIAAYGDKGVYDDLHPSSATANIAASTSAGKYRIILVGFTANRATWDNMLQTDGKGDEIFVSYTLQVVDGSGNSEIGGMEPTMRSYIYGDVWGQNAPNRRRGGQASDNGGFADGSSLPLIPWQGTPNTADPLSIPMALWSGTLTQGQNAVIVTPTLWEFDGTGYSGIFQDWTSWAGRLANVFSNPQKFMEVAGTQMPAAIDLGGMGAGLAIDLQESLLGSDGDRPIGMKLVNGHGVFTPKSIVFTQAVAEKMLEQRVGSLPQGVYPISYQDDPKWRGDYTVYIKVERLP